MPLFIPLLLLLSLFNMLFIVRDFSPAYIAAFIAGNMLWVFSFLGFHQLKLSLERYGVDTAHRTLKVFMVLHFLFCMGQLVNMMLITGQLNPYVGLKFPYGMSSGDNLFGTFMQNSLYNVTVSAFLAIYFIFKKNWLHAVLASLCVTLVFSNFGTILFAAVLFALLFTGIANTITSNRYPWLSRLSPHGYYALYLPMFMALVVMVYVTVSPENTKYLVDKIKSKIFSIELEGKNNYRTIIADQKINPKAYEYGGADSLDKKSEGYSEQNLTSFSATVERSDAAKGQTKIDIMRAMTATYVQKLQGKSLAVLETVQYLKSSNTKMLFGAGTTRFSSHIAQKMAGFDSSRLFMQVLPHFKSQEYQENHMLLIEERIKSTEEYFSTANFPDSFYNQILGEYGVLGALLFVVFYLGYYFMYIKRWTYGFWLFFIMLPFAHLSYIFDTMCVMLFFEWLMLTDIATPKPKQTDAQHA